MIDLEADATTVAQGPSDVVRQLANELVMLERRKDRLSEELKQVNTRIREVEFVALPTAMTEAHTKAYVLDSGWGVRADPHIEGTVPALGTIDREKDPEQKTALRARRDFVLAWLRQHGHGGLIKAEVTVSFGKGEEEQARQSVALLRAHGLSPVLEDSVHASTYAAWLKEMSKSGALVTLPLDEMGIRLGTRAVLVKPKL